MFPSADTSACSPLPSSGCRGRSLRTPCGSPPLQVPRGRKTARPSFPVASGLPWRSVPPMVRRRWGGALLGSWEIPLEACPELGTPATPARPRIIGRPSAAFRLVNGVGIATSRVFGAESSRPASLLCTLRTHRSPGEWQHSLPQGMGLPTSCEIRFARRTARTSPWCGIQHRVTDWAFCSS